MLQVTSSPIGVFVSYYCFTWNSSWRNEPISFVRRGNLKKKQIITGSSSSLTFLELSTWLEIDVQIRRIMQV